jgi:hypothetical protein
MVMRIGITGEGMKTPNRLRREHKSVFYAKFVGWKCANPSCGNGSNIESHHIIPINDGGPDNFWNLICLCRKCHRSRHLHGKWRENKITLFTWKTLYELNKWGFVLDEEDENYYDNYKILLSEDRKYAKK